MTTERGRSFDRKLEDVLVARLRDGQAPESLLEDLKARLGDAEADALLSRAESRIRPPPSSPLGARVMVGIAYLWTVMLVFQSIGVLYAATNLINLGGGESRALGQALIALALLKIALLCAGIAAYKWRRSALTTALYGLAITYAFPLGLFVDPLIGGYPPPGGATAAALSLAAAPSYTAVVLIGLVWWQGRAANPLAAEPAVFD